MLVWDQRQTVLNIRNFTLSVLLFIPYVWDRVANNAGSKTTITGFYIGQRNWGFLYLYLFSLLVSLVIDISLRYAITGDDLCQLPEKGNHSNLKFLIIITLSQ
jgi:hypothetical protein